ncbi:MAG: urease accessory protein UreF [Rhodospirillales bacterium]|jgi:urease accessory protein|nr:urease accessory protein UreF [Rhodospirillales bacterium]
MSNASLLLASLQHGDSFFPSGAVSFSWGLETLFSEGALTNADDIEAFARTQLQGRWAGFDRSVLISAHDAASLKDGDIDELHRIDAIVETQTLAREMRDGSHRSGLALLRVHEKMGTPGTSSYYDDIRGNKTRGHLSVMQGFVWARCGITKFDAQVIAAHALCVGLLGAALRLGAIGHVDSQRILASLRDPIDLILCHEAPVLERVHAFTPHSEIAVMRHETADSRLFAN